MWVNIVRKDQGIHFTFNFHTGHKEYKGNTMKLEEDQVLIMEGIHCLNDELTYLMNKFMGC